MSYTQEIIDLVNKYHLERWGTTFDLNETPWHKIVGYWWEAKAYYRLDGFAHSLDEVDPAKHKTAHVWVRPGVVHGYIFRDGKWVGNGELSEDLYK